MSQAAELSPPVSSRRGGRAMLASRVARGSWGFLRSAAWAPGVRPGKGRARGALLRSVPGCLGCLVERWWLRPAALGLRLPGASPRGHCSGAGKAAPGPAAGEDAAAEARGGRWGQASATSLVGIEEAAEGQPWVGIAGPHGGRTWRKITCSDCPKSDISVPELVNRSLKSNGQVIQLG